MKRNGMSLIELLVVLFIIGLVSSVAIFSLKKSEIIASPSTLSTLKKNLIAASEGRSSTLICKKGCQECFIRIEGSDKILPLSFNKEGEIIRYGFDRYGELRPMGSMVIPVEKGYEEVCFSLSYSSEGISSPLILKNNETFYVYTPLGGTEPLVTQNKEEIRDFIYPEDLTPMRNGSYYGAP